MKYCWYTLTVLLLVSALAWAQAKDAVDEPLYDFLCGVYQVIGKLPDSDQTYSGKVEIKLSDNHLEILRRIEGRAVRGIGKIETATPDKIKVLRVHFRSGDKDYEATYLISSDLDNHGRLTGHVYLKDGRTKTPGLEALFIDPSASKTPAKRNRT